MKIATKLFYISIIAVSGYTVWAWPWSDLKDKDEILALEAKKEYAQAAEEYWKWVKEKGDEEALKKLHELAKEALSDDLRKKYLQDGAAKVAQKRGMETQKYNGNLFIVAHDKESMTENIFKYHYSLFKSWKSIFRHTMQSLYPTLSFRGRKLNAFDAEGYAIPILTEDIVREEFENSDIKTGKTLALYCVDKTDSRKLIPAEEYPRTSYQEKMMAFVNLCQHYGASRIIMTRISDSKVDITVSCKADVDACTEKVQAKTSGSMQYRYSELFYVNLEFSGERQSGRPPKSPWLDSDFQDFVQRCECGNRLKKEEVTFKFSENIGVSAGFEGSLRKFGLELGSGLAGAGSKTQYFLCTYTVEF